MGSVASHITRLIIGIKKRFVIELENSRWFVSIVTNNDNHRNFSYFQCNIQDYEIAFRLDFFQSYVMKNFNVNIFVIKASNLFLCMEFMIVVNNYIIIGSCYYL